MSVLTAVPVVLSAPRYSPSLAHGLAILTGFTSERRVLGVADMAERLGLSRSNTHRYAMTLVALGFLEQTPARKYMLGGQAAHPGMALFEEILAGTGAEPVMCRLREQTGHTVGLGVLDRTHATYVRRWFAHGEGQYEADLGLRAGARVPLHCTALGKALLASLSDAERKTLLSRLDLRGGGGPNAIRTKKALALEIAQIGAAGLALSDQETATGVRSLAVAVPVRHRGMQLALDLTAPAGGRDVAGLAEGCGQRLSRAASDIAWRLRRTAGRG